MGSNSSKSINDTAGVIQKNDVYFDANPDSRSPTPEITRTLLQNTNENPIFSALIKNHLQFYDPRSPTQEFKRTPISIPSKGENEIIDKKNLTLKKNIYPTYASPCLMNDVDESFNVSENVIKSSPDLIVAKNLFDDFYDMSPNETHKENDEPLGSSTTSNNCIESNLSSENKEKPIKLLETNFDYVGIGKNIFEESEEIIKETSEKAVLKNLPLFNILNNDPRSPSLGIERTPIVVAKAKEVANVRNVEELSDDILTKVLQCTNSEQQSKDKDRKDLLIYEDEAIVTDTPKQAKSVNSNVTRKPLSCMKNKGDATHIKSKFANNHDSKKDLALPIEHVKCVSRIPRLKSLSKKTSMGCPISLKNISKT